METYITAEIISTVGLSMNLISAIMLWRYGLPKQINRSGSIGLQVKIDESMKKKAERYDLYSKIAIALMILGFLLQLVAIYFPKVVKYTFF